MSDNSEYYTPSEALDALQRHFSETSAEAIVATAKRLSPEGSSNLLTERPLSQLANDVSWQLMVALNSKKETLIRSAGELAAQFCSRLEDAASLLLPPSPESTPAGHFAYDTERLLLSRMATLAPALEGILASEEYRRTRKGVQSLADGSSSDEVRKKVRDFFSSLSLILEEASA